MWGSDKNISYMKTTLQIKEEKNLDCGCLSILEVPKKEALFISILW